MTAQSELTDFLNLSIGQATDAYLRELALVAIKSNHLTDMIEQLSGYQRGLAKVEAPKGKLIEDRYWVARDGTVTDQQTKLMWMQFSLEDAFKFDKVRQAVQHFNDKNRFAGYVDWRVPSKKELMSLIVQGNCPSICEEAFPGTPGGWFWTSTVHAENAADVWAVYFTTGSAFGLNRRYSGHIRLVR